MPAPSRCQPRWCGWAAVHGSVATSGSSPRPWARTPPPWRLGSWTYWPGLPRSRAATSANPTGSASWTRWSWSPCIHTPEDDVRVEDGQTRLRVTDPFAPPDLASGSSPILSLLHREAGSVDIWTMGRGASAERDAWRSGPTYLGNCRAASAQII